MTSASLCLGLALVRVVIAALGYVEPKYCVTEGRTDFARVRFSLHHLKTKIDVSLPEPLELVSVNDAAKNLHHAFTAHRFVELFRGDGLTKGDSQITFLAGHHVKVERRQVGLAKRHTWWQRRA